MQMNSLRKWRSCTLLMSRGALVIALSAAAPAIGANASVVYTYDALGRITTASYDTGVIVIYTYDANGNRTSQVINVNSGTLTWTAPSTPCTANCWGAALWD
jgi:YD repeat-containing protein